MDIAIAKRRANFFALQALFACVALTWSAFASADMMVDKNVMVSSISLPQIESLTISSPGKVTISVADLGWPKALSSLSFALSDASGVLKKMTGVGSLVYDVASPGAFFAAVYATPDPSVGQGLFHMNVSFAPIAPVPLPASAWLLVSGLCGVAALRGKRRNSSGEQHTTVAMPRMRLSQIS